MNEIAHPFLEALARGTEVDGGWKYGKALQQARLDFSRASLDRLDKLLRQIRLQARPLQDDFLTAPGGLNFCLLLAFYLGAVLEKSVPTRLRWHARADAAQALPPDRRLPAGLAAQVFGLAEAGALFLPLAWIAEALFGDGTAPSCADFLAGFASELARHAPAARARPARGGEAEVAAAAAGAAHSALSAAVAPARRPAHPGQRVKTPDAAAMANAATAPRTKHATQDAPSPPAVTAPGGVPVYADGQAVEVGDAVLFEHGFFPARIAALTATGGEAFVLRVEDSAGRTRALGGTAQAVAASLLFVARQPPDFRSACVQWLQRQTHHGARDQSLHSAAHARHALGNLLWHGIAVPKDIAQALRLWQAAADSGYAPAEYEIGHLHLTGEAVAADPARALNYLRRAAVKSDARALALMGRVHEQGQIVPEDLAQAVACYRRAAKLGDAGAMTQLARLQLAGRGVAEDAVQARERLAQAAEKGLAEAQFQLALCLQEGRGGAPDAARAAHWMDAAAAQGHGGALAALADYHERGLGVTADAARALQLYRQAADQGVPTAWFALGSMYAAGRGVERDLAQAIRWMRQAASHDIPEARAQLLELRREQSAHHVAAGRRAIANAAHLEAQTLFKLADAIYDPEIPESLPVAFELYVQAGNKGHAEAQYQAGFRYRRGLGVAASPQRAVAWYRKAAELDNVYALEELAQLHEDGEFLVQDLTKVFALLLRAARLHSVDAGYRVGCMYQDGRGVARDGEQAAKWLAQAARHKVGDARERLARLRKEGIGVGREPADGDGGGAGPAVRKPIWKFW